MKPLLAHIYEPHRVTFPCYVQPKLNGIRALYQNGNFQSRDEQPFSPAVLAHLSHPLKEVFGPEVILDGELYVHSWPLQRINAAVTPVRLQPTEDSVKVEYHVFDVVDFKKPFIHRTLLLTKLWQHTWPVKMVTIDYPKTTTRADELYAQFISEGYEGMMYRLGDCPYTLPKQQQVSNGPFNLSHTRGKFLSDKNNRCWHLLKRKDWQDHEFECVGVVEGEGKLTGTLGALICNVPKVLAMDSRFNVGSGLTDPQRAFYWQNPPIGKLIKVKYLCLSSDGIPLNPTIHPDHIIQ